MKQNFIITANDSTATELKKIGFKEILTSNKNIYTFLNCKSLNFSKDIDKNTIQYSNILTF